MALQELYMKTHAGKSSFSRLTCEDTDISFMLLEKRLFKDRIIMSKLRGLGVLLFQVKNF